MKTKVGTPTFVLLASVAGLVIAIAQDRGQEWKAPIRAAKKKNPIPPDEKSIGIGKKVYIRECLSCHGATGKGDGSAAKDLERHPGNLSDPRIWNETDGELFWKTTEGKKPMPAFEKTLTDEERWHVVNYMRTLAPRETGASPEFAAPETCRRALSQLLSNYLALHSALAKDDWAAAQKALTDLQGAGAKLAEIDGKGLDEKARPSWDESKKQLAGALGAMKDLSDIDSVRKSFKPLSEALASALAKFGHVESDPVRVFQCPMAFDKAGASWIQRANEPENPYFGKKMPACGNLTKTLGAKK